jgi:hypothetical protein
VNAVAAGEVGGSLETLAAQRPGLPGLGKRGEDGDEFGDTRWAGASVKTTHSLGDASTRFAGELDAAMGAGEELPDGAEFGSLEEILTEAILAKLDHERVGEPALAAPIVRQVSADQDEVAGTERGDVIADESQAVAGNDEGKFVFGMNVPRRCETGQFELAHDE